MTVVAAVGRLLLKMGATLATAAVPLRGTLHRCRSQRQHHRLENERLVCYASASLVLLPVMHNECPRHALSIQ